MIVLIIPVRMIAIPRLGVMISTPVGRIAIFLATVATVIVVTIANLEAQSDGPDMDAHYF